MAQADLSGFTSASSGPSGVTQIKAAAAAALSTHKGNTAPTYATAGTVWLDDAVANKWLLKVYDGADWIAALAIDVANNRVYAPTLSEGLNYPTAGGSANALTLTPVFPLAAYVDQAVITFKAASANSAAATINVSGLGAKDVKKIVAGVATALASGDIRQNDRYTAIYDAGANAFILTDGAVMLPNVKAWADLTLAANDLVYATGAAALAKTTLSSFMRGVLDDTSGLAVFNTLGGARSFAANGYTTLPDGTILQWGTASGAGDFTVSFPIAFPNACRKVVATMNGASMAGIATVFAVCAVDTWGPSSFVIRKRYAAAPSTINTTGDDGHWIAIGN